MGPYSRPFYQNDTSCPKVSLVVNSPSHHSHSPSQHSLATPLHLTSFGRTGSGSGSVSTPETESSQATDTIGSLDRDDDKGSEHFADLANNQEERDDEEAPPPPVAARPERTKSIVNYSIFPNNEGDRLQMFNCFAVYETCGRTGGWPHYQRCLRFGSQ